MYEEREKAKARAASDAEIAQKAKEQADLVECLEA